MVDYSAAHCATMYSNVTIVTIVTIGTVGTVGTVVTRPNISIAAESSTIQCRSVQWGETGVTSQ